MQGNGQGNLQLFFSKFPDFFYNSTSGYRYVSLADMKPWFAADQMDDERRKNFMRKPGFRKSAFKKLKLAIMYGTAAQCKLALVIPLAICRHFSKDKDRRMRNELIMEIDTQIKVTDAKISDAEAKGDRKELYHLIRIKDQLTRERSRVLTNSKYI